MPPLTVIENDSFRRSTRQFPWTVASLHHLWESDPILLKNCHVILPLENHAVSRVTYSYTSPFSPRLALDMSGKISSAEVGYLERPNINQNMNHVMASCCITSTVPYSPNIHSLSVSSAMRVWMVCFVSMTYKKQFRKFETGLLFWSPHRRSSAISWQNYCP